MTLRDLLTDGAFIVTAELGPPADADGEKVLRTATALSSVVHAANVTDNQAATVKMSPLVCASFMLESGLEPILQLTGRDRNVLALQADLLGAWALGVRSVMALSGDPLSVGAYESLASEVRDVDSLRLTRLIATLNGGSMLAGEKLSTATDFLIVGAANPLVDSLERLQAKLDAGVRLVQTNIVYDVDRFAEWFSPVVAAGVADSVPVLVGVTPPRSLKMLQYLHERVPGVEVTDSTFVRMTGLEGEAAKAEGIRIACDIVAALQEIDGVAGVHIMAPGWEAEAVPKIVQAAGIGPTAERTLRAAPRATGPVSR
jgi:5,10-methylenetetrahydrofolate reductase